MTGPIPQQALSSGGKVLFGGLTAGTFVLGVWQTQRYFEKETLVEQREQQLKKTPVTSLSAALQRRKDEPFRQWQLSGKFNHRGEVLVGPRGIPAGALPKKTKSQGVMGDANTAGPQGYLVVTPFEITEEDATSKYTRTVFINRGWIPKDFIDKATSTEGLWSRPEGLVPVRAIPTQVEEPKWIKPQHNFKTRPLQLLYFDGGVLKDILKYVHPEQEQHHVTEEEDDLILLTQIKAEPNEKGGKLSFPLQPPPDKVAEFTISPTIHAGYAITWFGLSGAGMIMTRKLLTRGRR